MRPPTEDLRQLALSGWMRKAEDRVLWSSLGKVVCGACGGKCSGEVLRVSDKYFHTACFTCRACAASLARGGFFCRDGHYYCPQDYQRSFGTRCAACGQYVEGEVVSALGNTYHQKCFTCARCKRAFPSGEKVTYTGAEVVCSGCVAGAPQRQTARSTRSPAVESSAKISHDNHVETSSEPKKEPAENALLALRQTARSARSPAVESSTKISHENHVDTSSEPKKEPAENECAGCGQELSEGQALVALDRQWHTWCFACGACGQVLQGEYMGRGGTPYCERDYQRLFGVRCAHCDRYISGKVLQAGDNHHFHPTCARCSKCGDPFGDGEEMFLQGAAIWHPRCGPAPGHAPSRPESELQFSTRSRTPSVTGSYCSPYSSLNRKYTYGAVSPGLTLREYRSTGACSPHRITTYSYLSHEPQYLRRPLQPYDRPPASPHFHRPASESRPVSVTGMSSATGTRSSSRPGSKASSRPGMRALVDSIRSETPRPKSPGMNNEEPIELSHYPSAYKPAPGTKSKIERDDFPAPPYPYTDPERRRRWSDTYKGVDVSDEETDGQVNGKVNGNSELIDPQLRREERELSNIGAGIAQVFLKEVKEREKMKMWKKQNLDPRNASRTPSASKEPAYRLRYSSPVGASPSRQLEERRARESEMSAYYAHTSHSHIPSYNVMHAAPRPGYGLRSSTLPAGVGHHCNGDFTFSGMGDKTHSTDFSSGKSDISAGSITDVDRSAVTTTDGVLPPHVSLGPSRTVRRSLPNMATSALLHEPAKLYPYHLLLITNYRLPPDVDRLNLERHLSDAEFEAILQIPRPDFYRLPQWRRNELKRRARLF
ncbi:unnamed protein product [Plutella xylostella]|uniref:(diamondback moth) hypothetical protein n=1 Tax=Plutella xylostella TaxID=51655 RepID=A0A8S4G287_PLUXY|nr:unnamed protein product [Plutella xylostella]